MNNKMLRKAGLISLMVIANCTFTYAQGRSILSLNDPWKAGQLLPAEQLVSMIKKGEKIQIYNIGPVANIKGAVSFGAASEAKNLEKFKLSLKNKPRNQRIVFYCGCCPMNKCPNIRPAFKMLQQMNFTNMQVLELPTNIRVDWINKGYPID
ncbi:MAG: rhodanese-like domain-containing protein [Pedobacter sp.]|jgi:hypothetical protein|uniref:rhodanese-like domain-containing protein n=1 Tax=Pedobacter sp. TaxID=1411316 RepID=UPI00356ADA96